MTERSERMASGVRGEYPEESSLANQVTWSIAGELDSPIAPGQLEVVRARMPEDLGSALRRHCEKGNLIVIGANRQHPSLVDTIVSHLPDEVGESDKRIKWASSSGEFTASLRDLIDRLKDPVLAKTVPQWIILERPDLAFDGGAQIDGLACRTMLHQLSKFSSDHIVIVTVSPDAFMFHDPYPGWIRIEARSDIRDCSASSEPLPSSAAADWADDPLIEAVVSALEAGDDVMLPLFLALSQNRAGRDLSELGIDEKTLRSIGAERIRAQLRSLISSPMLPENVPSRLANPQTLALVTARLYIALFSLEREGPRSTFVDLDVGRWFCLLRSASYETLAAVASRLGREDLSGVNLMHAPPLAFGCLAGANLEDADLYRVDFSYMDLSDANLRGADLSRSHLKGADLRGSDLTDADLSYTSLELSDLRGAKLDGADRFRSFDDDALW